MCNTFYNIPDSKWQAHVYYKDTNGVPPPYSELFDFWIKQSQVCDDRQADRYLWKFSGYKVNLYSTSEVCVSFSCPSYCSLCPLQEICLNVPHSTPTVYSVTCISLERCGCVQLHADLPWHRGMQKLEQSQLTFGWLILLIQKGKKNWKGRNEEATALPACAGPIRWKNTAIPWYPLAVSLSHFLPRGWSCFFNLCINELSSCSLPLNSSLQWGWQQLNTAAATHTCPYLPGLKRHCVYSACELTQRWNIIRKLYSRKCGLQINQLIVFAVLLSALLTVIVGFALF